MSHSGFLLLLLALTSTALAVAASIIVYLLRKQSRFSRHSDHEGEHREHQFAALVNGVTEYAIYMIDPDGRVATWNIGAERKKGYTSDEIIGQHFSRFYTEEDRAANLPQKALQAALEKGQYEAEGWRVRKDGTRFFANVVIDSLRDASGQHIGYAKVTRDVTDRLRQREALAEAQAVLAQSQKMDAIGQLSGGIAHDFNNLLHVIANANEALSRTLASSDPKIVDLLARARRSTDRAATLTKRLLAFSRRQPLAPVALDPNRVVLDMKELLQSSLGERISLEIPSRNATWQTSVDQSQFETSILNLAINARDAMPNGGTLTIETSNTLLDHTYSALCHDAAPGEYVLLEVRDTGIGMTSDVVSRAFDPFFTTKRVADGAGLGLSQVYGFINQSGGHVKIYSEPDHGTTIKLYLPRLLAASTHIEQKQIEFGDSLPGKGEILLVEDEEDVRVFTAEMLRELGYGVTATSNAASALAALDTMQPFDLLFTDVGLPDGIDGQQLAERATYRRPGLKVLFTTGYARNAIIHEGRLDPGVELITKPFTQGTLAQKLNVLLAESS